MSEEKRTIWVAAGGLGFLSDRIHSALSRMDGIEIVHLPEPDPIALKAHELPRNPPPILQNRVHSGAHEYIETKSGWVCRRCDRKL